MRLGGSASVVGEFPARPHGMWQRTYDRLRNAVGETKDMFVSLRQGCVNGRYSTGNVATGMKDVVTRGTGDTSGMESVRTRFEEWRTKRIGKTPIRDELWSMAIDVARREGVNRTAQQLHLDAGKLKRLLVARNGGKRKTRRQPRFVELVATVAAANPGCVIEFESAGGGKMRIHWEAGAPTDWTSLLRAWRDAER